MAPQRYKTQKKKPIYIFFVGVVGLYRPAAITDWVALCAPFSDRSYTFRQSILGRRPFSFSKFLPAVCSVPEVDQKRWQTIEPELEIAPDHGIRSLNGKSPLVIEIKLEGTLETRAIDQIALVGKQFSSSKVTSL